MATNITVTEILGTDSMNNSRVTINNNFRTLASAINTINSVVSTQEIGNNQIKFVGNEIVIGSIRIKPDGIYFGNILLDTECIQGIVEFFKNKEYTMETGSNSIAFRVDNDDASISINGREVLTETGTGY